MISQGERSRQGSSVQSLPSLVPSQIFTASQNRSSLQLQDLNDVPVAPQFQVRAPMLAVFTVTKMGKKQ